MSSGRRPVVTELKGTLGTLIRSTLEQVGVVTDAAREKARLGQRRIDEALLERKLKAALAEVGEVARGLVADGRIDAAAFPELSHALDRVEALEAPIAELDESADEPTRGSPRAAWSRVPRSSERSARRSVAPDPFDAEGRASGVWRPPEPSSSGGTRFTGEALDDEDLAEYMHADDVPPRRG
jgi:hypothetical protein